MSVSVLVLIRPALLFPPAYLELLLASNTQQMISSTSAYQRSAQELTLSFWIPDGHGRTKSRTMRLQGSSPWHSRATGSRRTTLKNWQGMVRPPRKIELGFELLFVEICCHHFHVDCKWNSFCSLRGTARRIAVSEIDRFRSRLRASVK